MITLPTADDDGKHQLHRKKELKLQPVTLQHTETSSEEAVRQNVLVLPPQQDAAVQLIRGKLDTLYAKEPDADEEAVEAFQAGTQRTKHQQYMYDLTNSGKSLADIQIEWHAYYAALPDNEKHEVWQEFYAAHSSEVTNHAADTQQPSAVVHERTIGTKWEKHEQNDPRTIADIKHQLMRKAMPKGVKLQARHHIQSLLFGLGTASFVVLILLFSFFNERFIVPFISPSRQVSATPIVGTSGDIGPDQEIIIPKINLEVPVIYGTDSTSEQAVEDSLQDGVVHYSTTAMPGETGNVVIVGHSSNNILNKGKYKFAFVLLKRLEIGDSFSLNKGGTRYTYQIYDKKVVKPTDVSVLGPATKDNSATLITCDPPGTSLNRLVVIGVQISPDPKGNTIIKSSRPPTLTSQGILPGNAPSLWQKIKAWF